MPTIVGLKKDIDDDSDDTNALIILIGGWIKLPKPNLPDILPDLDGLFSRWTKLKPKLPQPPQDEPECEHLRKRFWPFNIISDTVKNPVQAVEKIGLSLGSIRAQLTKGVIDGVADELVNLNALNDAMKKYDPSKDPCNKESTKLSSESAVTTSHSSSPSSSSSSSSCSARTVSNCNVVCTTTRSIKPTGGNTKRAVDECSTSCGPPTVTCGASATTDTSTVTSTIVVPNYCDNKCCKKLPDHTPKPLPTQNAGTTPRGLHKRVLPQKDREPWNGNMFNFRRDMCSAHSLVEEMESKDPDKRPTTGAQYVLGPNPMNVCFPGLYGCTMVVVLSRYYLWMAHFIEVRSAMKPENWDEHVFKPIEFGEHGSNIPADQSLAELGKAGGAFAPETNPVAIIIGPFKRRTDLATQQSTDLLYPEFSAKIEETILRAMPHARIQYAPYAANAAQFWGFDNVSNEEKATFVDENYPYKTPYGKVLVTYDTNKYGAKKGDGCKTVPGWEIWVEDATFSRAYDEWPALPLQVPDGWQNHKAGVIKQCFAHCHCSFQPARPITVIATALPSITPTQCGDKDCDCCGNYKDNCKRLWCPVLGKSGDDCEDYCFSEQCHGDVPSECKLNGRCHRPTCPEKKGGKPKRISKGFPIVAEKCTSATDCGCCKDWFDQCLNGWIPDGYSPTKAYVFCLSEMCYSDQAPSQCRKNPGGCLKYKATCPDKKGDRPKGPVPTRPCSLKTGECEEKGREGEMDRVP